MATKKYGKMKVETQNHKSNLDSFRLIDKIKRENKEIKIMKLKGNKNQAILEINDRVVLVANCFDSRAKKEGLLKKQVMKIKEVFDDEEIRKKCKQIINNFERCVFCVEDKKDLFSMSEDDTICEKHKKEFDEVEKKHREKVKAENKQQIL